ncbi:hypothetical protein LK12_00570 [Novosphingobium malaysiense]|uniref:IclR family transcriptional regulator n=1 Tax=Novosphingobium malaysiense TaxID=1348853 RepID=A0A0B1ZW24_9SPHN|nr:hypothetical protein LK12_00570 [Novosphingobium malaysiense]
MTDDKPDQPGKRAPRIRPVPAVTRAVAILRLLGQHANGLGVKAIADELGLVPSTGLHILRALVAENLVRQDPDTKRYTLGSGMVGLARAALANVGFASLAKPLLDGLAAKWGLTIMGTEITPRETLLVLSVARPDQPLQLHASVGSEFYHLTSATGRLVAAYTHLSTPELRAKFSRIQWDRPMPFEDWLAEVEVARNRGWAVDRDRFKNGITAYAVPLLSLNGAMTHSLVAMGISAEMPPNEGEALAHDMQVAADTIARQLSAD